MLNAAIDWSQDVNSVYTKGKGILVRSPFDGYEKDETKIVVPATFWVNDIFAPSQLYPGNGGGTWGNPWCPTTNAPWSCDEDYNDETGPWNYPQFAVVIGSHSALQNLFYDFDNIQSHDWGYGVFYPSDSNSVDQRCRYLDSEQGWDCPGGFLQMDGAFTADENRLGAGSYNPGNPHVNDDWGGGTGCHFDMNSAIDQTDAYDSEGNNLVQNYDCECNYNFNQNSPPWWDWVSQWKYNGGVGGDSWEMDLGSCWTNNIRDMIQIQNALWWRRTEWSSMTVPQADYNAGTAQSGRAYWGWNEIPMSRQQMDDQNNWDAIMIKLPAGACGGDGKNDLLSCYDIKYHWAIDDSLQQYISAGYLGLGPTAKKPSSSVVLAREYMDGSGNFFREFFCESWGPIAAGDDVRHLRIMYNPKGKTRGEHECFVDTDQMGFINV